MSSLKLDGEDSVQNKLQSELLSKVFDDEEAVKTSFKKKSFLNMAKGVGVKLGFTGIVFTGAVMAVAGFYTAKHVGTAIVASDLMDKHIYNSVPQNEIENFKKLKVDSLQPIKELMEPEFNKVMADGKMTFQEKQALEDKLTRVTEKLYGTPFANENTPLLSEKNKNKPK